MSALQIVWRWSGLSASSDIGTVAALKARATMPGAQTSPVVDYQLRLRARDFRRSTTIHQSGVTGSGITRRSVRWDKNGVGKHKEAK